MDELEFEIFFSDLKPEAQERLLAFMKVKNAAELNWDNDTLPVASVPASDEEFDLLPEERDDLRYPYDI